MKFDIVFGNLVNGVFTKDENGLDFRAVLDTENGTVIKEAVCKFAAAWSPVGGTTFRFVANNGKIGGNKPIGESGVRQDGVHDDFWYTPKGTRLVTLEGKRASKDTLVSASILPIPA